jgi:predicted amidohydrolase YtcJ
MAADMVLIDGDLETVPVTRIGATPVALTVCAGKITYAGAGFA